MFDSRLQQVRERLYSLVNRLREFRKRVETDKNKVRNELDGYTSRASKSLQRARETIIERDSREFRESLDGEIKRASTASGLEIERSLREPKRQKMVEMIRKKIRDRQNNGMNIEF